MEVTLDLDETPLLLSSGLRRDTGGGLCPLGLVNPQMKLRIVAGG